jgi:hypothetical protein
MHSDYDNCEELSRHVNSLLQLLMTNSMVNSRLLLYCTALAALNSVLGCGYVDDVLIDAPAEMTREMIASLSVCAVVQGTVDDNGWSTRSSGSSDSSGSSSDDSETDAAATATAAAAAMADGTTDATDATAGSSSAKRSRGGEYALAKQLGIYHQIKSPSNLTVMEIMGRIQKNQEVRFSSLLLCVATFIRIDLMILGCSSSCCFRTAHMQHCSATGTSTCNAAFLRW